MIYTILGFFKDNWRWVIPIVLGAGAVYGAYSFYDSKLKESYDRGYGVGMKDTDASWNGKIDEEAKRNQEFEVLLRGIIVEFGEKAVREAIARNVKEQSYQSKIRTIIKDNPIYQQCTVDEALLQSRNNIRGLGPVKINLDEVKK